MTIILKDVQPSLRGLWMTSMDAQPRELWPWQNVSHTQEGLVPVCEDGSPFTENGRKVRFRFPSDHAKLVAKGAHLRWWKRAFELRQFNIAEVVNRNIANRLMVAFYSYAITFFAGPPSFFVFVYLKNRQDGTWSHMPTTYLLLFALTAIFLWSAAAGIGIVLLRCAMRLLRQRNLRQINLDGDGFQLHYSEGPEIRQSWNDVATITRDNHVRFRDGGSYWSIGFSRVALLMQVARQQLFAQAIEAELVSTKRRFGGYACFAGLYVLSMAFLASTMPPEPDRPQPFYAIALLFFVMCAGAIFVPTSWMRLDRGWHLKYLKYNRKQRRAAHRKAIRRMQSQKFLN